MYNFNDYQMSKWDTTKALEDLRIVSPETISLMFTSDMRGLRDTLIYKLFDIWELDK